MLNPKPSQIGVGLSDDRGAQPPSAAGTLGWFFLA